MIAIAYLLAALALVSSCWISIRHLAIAFVGSQVYYDEKVRQALVSKAGHDAHIKTHGARPVAFAHISYHAIAAAVFAVLFLSLLDKVRP